MIAHRHAAVVKRGVEELRDACGRLRRARRLLSGGRARAGLGLGLNRERQPVEELPHARRQRRRQLVERVAHVLLERRRRETLDQRAAEIERAQLGEVEAGLVEAPERALLERPVALAVVDLVEERKSGFLERFEVAADRPRRDAGAWRPDRRSSVAATIRGRAGSTTGG